MTQQTGFVKKAGLSGALGLVILLMGGKIYAQDFQRPPDPLDSIPAQHYLSLRHDNDFFNVAGAGTDEYYTSGIYLEYSFLARRNNILNKILFSPRTTSPSFFTIGATQWMYTPDSLDNHNNPRQDYPYCGVLFLHFTRENLLSPKQLFRSELWLGTTGSPALADQTQVFVHHFIKSVIPRGWDHQIPTYPVVNYNLYYERNLLSLGRLAKINGVAYTQTGTLLNTAELGLNVLLSNQKDNFFPARIYHVNNQEASKKWKVFLELRPSVKFVATNAMLQGRLWGPKDYYHINAGDLHRVLLEGTGLIGLRIKNFAIDYRQVFQSAEFKSVHSHVWGAFTISCRL
ncbi:MAG TPA: lipid A deacylase LpxR family protein [Puia sp.]|nr:lipid A deacylase LpxR family protein [Puia sp.]